MNRINQLFQNKKGNILSVYFTAGYPKKEATTEIIRELAQQGADLIEIGTSVDTSLMLYDDLPDEVIKISESGISSTESVHKLRQAGYDGFLMGENFMKEVSPGDALKSFCQQIV